MTTANEKEKSEPGPKENSDAKLTTKDKVWVGIAIGIFVILFVLILVFGLF
ncbi:MAG TPA: hypothetical protein VFF30_04675 [Nitrososphaerales archaeon]|nr:hypothetical protein [Nitrososphaerales archaeon]